MNISDVLDRAADLIEPEGRWVQGPFAADAKGREIFEREKGPIYPGATCFCIAGAINKVLGRRNRHSRMDVKAVLSSCIGANFIDFNEAPGRTQPEVVAKLREAAAKAREQGL
jgi:hypothetical protein